MRLVGDGEQVPGAITYAYKIQHRSQSQLLWMADPAA